MSVAATTAAPAAPRLTAATKMAYGTGAMANGVKSAAFSSYLMLYFNQVIGVPAGIVGTALALTLLVDAFVDPFLGRWADTASTRWGRRHPFMYAAAIPTTLLFYCVWFPPSGLSHMELGLWIFAFASGTRAAISAFEINSAAMAPELTTVYAERTKLFSLRYWFGYSGAYGFTAFSLAFIFVESEAFPRGQLNPASYANFALLGAVLIFLAIMVSTLGTHNRIPYLRQAEDSSSMPASQHLREMFAAFRNRAFLSIFGFGVFKYTAIGLYSAMALYWGTYLFKLSAGALALLTLDSLLAATIAAPLAPWFSNRFGKRRTSMVFAVVGISIGLSPLYLSYFDLFFVPGNAMLVPALFTIGTIYMAMIAISLINTSAMLADVVEESALETGKHTAGTFFAASSFMQQCSTALGLFAAGWLLAAAEFPERADPETLSEGVVDTLLALYIPTILGLWTIGALILKFYPISRERHKRNVEMLRAREAEALDQVQSNAPLGGPAR